MRKIVRGKASGQIVGRANVKLARRFALKNVTVPDKSGGLDDEFEALPFQHMMVTAMMRSERAR